MTETRDEQLDHAASIVTWVGVGADTEVADAVHQFECIDIRADVADFSGGGE